MFDARRVSINAGGRMSLPIACTLGPSEGAQRVQEWQRLMKERGSGREWTAGQVILYFEDVPAVSIELPRLVALERSCCGFLDWHLARDARGWRVEIRGTEDELKAIAVTL
jgi:hypothetical protein